MLSLDYSVFIQLANFLVLLFLLNIILYRPVRRILKQRNEEMSKLGQQTAELEAEASARSRGLEESEAGVRKQGFKEKEVLKNDALELEKKMYQEASASAGSKIEEARRGTEKKVREIRQVLEKEVQLFSRELSEKVLGRRLS